VPKPAGKRTAAAAAAAAAPVSKRAKADAVRRRQAAASGAVSTMRVQGSASDGEDGQFFAVNTSWTSYLNGAT
jgi:hypothetical protein